LSPLPLETVTIFLFLGPGDLFFFRGWARAFFPIFFSFRGDVCFHAAFFFFKGSTGRVFGGHRIWLSRTFSPFPRCFSPPECLPKGRCFPLCSLSEFLPSTDSCWSFSSDAQIPFAAFLLPPSLVYLFMYRCRRWPNYGVLSSRHSFCATSLLHAPQKFPPHKTPLLPFSL